jgi:hypothetical protein
MAEILRPGDVVPGFSPLAGHSGSEKVFDLSGFKSGNIPEHINALHTRQFNGVVNNIGTALERATDADIVGGQNWYPEAQHHARRIGHLNALRQGTRVSDEEATNMGAAMIAIHSPQNEWDRNLMAAHSVALTGGLDPDYGLHYRGSRQHLSKSLPVARGDVAPSEGIVNAGRPRLKTYHFFENIRDPRNSSQFVTVDRHAHDVGTGRIIGGDSRGLDLPHRYSRFVDAYSTAHHRFGADYDLRNPSDVQAASWVSWKRLKGDRRSGSDFDEYLKSVGNYDQYYNL